MSIGLAVFIALITVTDGEMHRTTDHATGSVTAGRMFARSWPSAMQPMIVILTIIADVCWF